LSHENHRVVHSINSHPNGKELMTAAESFVYLWTTEEADDEQSD